MDSWVPAVNSRPVVVVIDRGLRSKPSSGFLLDGGFLIGRRAGIIGYHWTTPVIGDVLWKVLSICGGVGPLVVALNSHAQPGRSGRAFLFG